MKNDAMNLKKIFRKINDEKSAELFLQKRCDSNEPDI